MGQELVLLFHGIGVPPPDVSKAERPYWIATNDFVAFIASAGKQADALGIKLIATFDDGNRSDRDIAAPLLKQHGVRGIFFPLVGRIGEPGYLGADDIRALEQDGFEIGSHGIVHVDWTCLRRDRLEHEILGSRNALREILGHTVQSVALPFGEYNRRVLAALRTSGYSAVYSSDCGLSRSGLWFRLRWCYRVGEPFEICQLVATSKTARHRAIIAAKNLVKSLR
jgi:peptidoglycan/xylan/chitin deacetylase (PgdA/CDA1 family)